MTSTPTLLDRAVDWRDRLAGTTLLDGDMALMLDAAINDARAGKILSPPPPVLTIMLLGATGGGKSELLNALAGETIAVSHHLRPTTTMPTIYMPRDIQPRRLYEYGAELGDMAMHGGNVKTHDRTELLNKVIIDAPDIDSYRTEHREQVMRLLPLVDVALYVVTPFSYKDDLGWTVVLQERGRRAFAFVMNKWDAEGMPRITGEGPGPGEDFIQLVERRAGYRDPKIFFTSARTWAAPEIERATLPAMAAGENFQELRQWLEQGLSTSRVEQIQRRRRRALWGSLAGAITEALPPEISIDQARSAILPEIENLQVEGATSWRAVIGKRTEALARYHEEEGRPHSPGPFGRLSSGVSALVHFGQSWKKVTEPQPDATGEEIEAVAHRSSELVSRRMASIEWKLREMDIPTEGLNTDGLAFGDDQRNRFRTAFETASSRIRENSVQRWRLVTGWVILAVFEVLTVALLGLAAWRLVEAFVAGQYLDLRFTLNLLALVMILLMAGSGVMAVLFPPVKTRIRRQLENTLRTEWMQASDRLTVAVDRHLENLSLLREEGQALFKEADAEVAKIYDEIEATRDDETERLFKE